METYQIKIILLDTHPPVWRRVLVARDITLRQLHRIVQTGYGVDRFARPSVRLQRPEI
jgi:hypothetical protein